MSFKFTKTIVAAGLICTSLTAIAALAQNTNGEVSGSSVPLPPPGPFTTDSNLAAPEKAAEKPVEGKKFAPLNFDPEKPAADATASTDIPKPKDDINVEADAPKPAYAPAETAIIPVEKTPETKVDGLPTSVGAEVQIKADAKEPVIEKPAVDATTEKTLQPAAEAMEKPAEAAEENLPKYAPVGTAEAPMEREPAKSPTNAETETDAPNPSGNSPSYAPAGTGTAPPPVNTAPSYAQPGYGYQQPQFMPRPFLPPQFQAPQFQVPQYQNRQYPTPQPAPGYGYAPQYYPPGYFPQQGFWPQQGYQPYPNQQMQQQPWGNQQQQPRGYQQPQPQMQQQQQGNQQPQWQHPQQWQMPPQGYGYPNPNYWNPFRPPAQQGWPQQNTPRTNNQPGN